MKVRFTIILMLFIGLATLIITLQLKDVDFDQVKIEDLDDDIQNAIKQIKEQNIYLITKNRTIILYSNLGKSGMYTYPYAEIKRKGDKLIVNIKSKMAADEEFVKEILVVRINIKHLPQEIETTFLDQKTNYRIINLNN
jgi:hypothetical protein